MLKLAGRFSLVVLILFAVVGAVLSWGCVDALQSKYATTDKLYDGPYKDRRDVALLVQHDDQRAHVVEVNGVRLRNRLGVVFELLPGSYLVGFSFAKIKGNTSITSEFDQRLRITVHAGHTYEFDGVLVKAKPKDKWYLNITDITLELDKPKRAKFREKIKSIFLNSRTKAAGDH